MRPFLRNAAVLALSIFSIAAVAQSSVPTISKPPAWVEAVTFDANATPPAGQEEAFYYLLVDEQENLNAQSRFFRVAYKILTTQGIQSMSDISVDFDPSYQRLTFHHARVHRNGAIINQLIPPIKTIQREQSMDRNLYDGSLTAIIHLKDVRVGDIIEYAYSTTGYNPVFEGHFARNIYFTFGVPYEKLQRRLLAPADRPLRFLQNNIDIKAEVTDRGPQREYVWTQRRKNALLQEDNAPSWYQPGQFIAISDYSSWRDVAVWAERHFEVSQAELRTLRERMSDQFTSEDPEEFIAKAIRFVQDEIRYLGFESGLNSHKPHAPLKVFDQRFGDCKDKSLLLCAILRTEGIEAWPVLVNTSRGNHVAKELPSATAFDHCVVQIKWDGNTYNVDPTLSNQGGQVSMLHFPDYGKGLVIAPATTDLEDLNSPATSNIYEEQRFSMADLEGEAYLQVTTKYTGAQADATRRYFHNNTLEGIQKNYTTFYGNLYPDIEVASPIEYKDDREINVFEVTETYRIPTFWKALDDTDMRYAQLSAQTLEGYFSMQKAARTAPYALTYPLSYRHSIHVAFPEPWNVQPEVQQINSDYYDYNYSVNYSGNELSLETHYRTLKDHVPAEDFEKFVADHTTMSNNLSFQLSFSKALTAPSQGISWFGLITGLIALGLALWLTLHIYYYYDPMPAGDTTGDGLAIGGWLILPALGLCFAPLRMVYDMFQLPEYYDAQTWTGLWVLGRIDLLCVMFVTHIYNIFLLCFSVLVLVLFFQRRSSVPKLMTIYLAVTNLMTILDTGATILLDPTSDRTAAAGSIFRAIVAAAIWIPYFNISTRVKDTFVQRLNDDSNDDFDTPGESQVLARAGDGRT